jgi:putative transposase
MPRKKKSNAASETQPSVEPKIPKELLDQLVTGPITQGEFESIFRALKKAVIEERQVQEEKHPLNRARQIRVSRPGHCSPSPSQVGSRIGALG